MSNGKLNKDSVQILLGLISDLTLHGFRDEEKNETLEELSKLLKKDLQEASELEDISFISNVIVPLLHAEKKIPI